MVGVGLLIDERESDPGHFGPSGNLKDPKALRAFKSHKNKLRVDCKLYFDFLRRNLCSLTQLCIAGASEDEDQLFCSQVSSHSSSLSARPLSLAKPFGEFKSHWV